MKKIKQFMLVLALACVAVFTTSCEDEVSMDRIYGTGLYEYSSSSILGELQDLEDYFESKGFTGTILVNGTSVEDCNAKAIAEFNAKIANVSTTDIQAIVSSTTTFSYQLIASTSSSDEESETLARYDYPAAD